MAKAKVKAKAKVTVKKPIKPKMGRGTGGIITVSVLKTVNKKK